MPVNLNLMSLEHGSKELPGEKPEELEENNANSSRKRAGTKPAFLEV